MKKFAIFLLIMGILAGCNNSQNTKETKVSESGKSGVQAKTNAQESKASASFAFSETEWDFGTIEEGEVVSHTFEFKNTGETPLVIQSARGSCGCTVPDYPRDPIGVDETGEIEVKFNSAGRPNVQNKTVSITANTNPKITVLKIRALVNPKIEQALGPVRK